MTNTKEGREKEEKEVKEEGTGTKCQVPRCGWRPPTGLRHLATTERLPGRSARVNRAGKAAAYFAGFNEGLSSGRGTGRPNAVPANCSAGLFVALRERLEE